MVCGECRAILILESFQSLRSHELTPWDILSEKQMQVPAKVVVSDKRWGSSVVRAAVEPSGKCLAVIKESLSSEGTDLVPSQNM